MVSLSAPTSPKRRLPKKMDDLAKYRNKVKIFNTEQFTHFIEQNLDRNRGFPVEIIPKLDPSGWHILKVIIPHGECDLRCWAMAKETGTEDAMRTIMDIDVKDFLQGHDPSQLVSSFFDTYHSSSILFHSIFLHRLLPLFQGTLNGFS